MISKELLQRIVNNLTVKEVVSTDDNRIDNNIYYTLEEIDILQSINIYELAYRCREWARNNEYEVSACRPIVSNDEGKAVINYWYKSYIFKFELGAYHGTEQILKFDVNVSSEPEAVFRACEWILTQIKNN
jgi:hypothetical protein